MSSTPPPPPLNLSHPPPPPPSPPPPPQDPAPTLIVAPRALLSLNTGRLSRQVQNSRPRCYAELSTARLILRPLDPTLDATDLFEMDADPLVHQFAYGSSPSHSIDQLAAPAGRGARSERRNDLGVRLRDDPTALGTVGIFADQGTAIRGLSWSLRRSHWGQGLMSEAASAIVPFLLAQRDRRPGGVGRLHNIGSLKVATRAGLTERARLPRSYDDHVAQTVVMAIAAGVSIRRCSPSPAAIDVHDVEATAQLLCGLFGVRRLDARRTRRGGRSRDCAVVWQRRSSAATPRGRGSGD